MTYRFLILLFVAATLSACGGGGGGDTAEPDPPPITQPPPPTNNAPRISGTPPTTAQAGSPYSFTPAANDDDGDTLSFAIDNLPGWASFNTITGQLSGTPQTVDIGNYDQIIISVSDGTDTTAMPAFSINVVEGGAGAASLSWDPPTTNTDNSALTDLAGYKIYYGNTPGNYTAVETVANPGLSSYVVDNLASGSWYFVVTATDGAGNESAVSNEVSKVVP